MAWVVEDCSRPLRIGDKRIEYGRLLKEQLQVEEEMRKKVEKQLETKGAELEGSRVELMAAQAEVAQLKEAFSKYREDASMEVSRLHARAKDAERRVARVPGEITIAKTMALFESKSSVELTGLC